MSDEISTSEAAGRLGVTRRMVTNWCRSGVLRARLIAGRWIVEAASVEALRREREGR